MGVPCRTAVGVMPVPAVHEEVDDRARRKQEVRQDAEDMGSVLGQEEESDDSQSQTDSHGSRKCAAALSGRVGLHERLSGPWFGLPISIGGEPTNMDAGPTSAGPAPILLTVPSAWRLEIAFHLLPLREHLVMLGHAARLFAGLLRFNGDVVAMASR